MEFSDSVSANKTDVISETLVTFQGRQKLETSQENERTYKFCDRALEVLVFESFKASSVIIAYNCKTILLPSSTFR